MNGNEDGCCGKMKPVINFQLLPIKLHYFVLYAALGAVMPYIPIIAKGLGMSATSLGIIFTILPFIVTVAKPSFGVITDRFRNIRVVIAVLVIITSVSYFVIIFIPALNHNSADDKHVHLKCTQQGSELTFPKRYNASCLSDKLLSGPDCYFIIDECSLIINQTNATIYDVTSCNPICNETAVNHTLRFQPSVLHFNESNDQSKFAISSIDINGQNVTSICWCAISALVTLTCLPSIHNCSSLHPDEDETSDHDIFLSYQFWSFGILCIMAGMGQAVMFTLSDAACYELLADRPDQYGRQRLWATVSWGIVALLTGFLNDLASTGSKRVNYAPGFYMMLGLALLDLLLLSRIKLVKAKVSSNICKDIGSVFHSCEVVAFAMGVFIVGGLTGMIWNYQFWFLESLGASQLLLGLTVLVQCLLAEVPFFFFSGFIIEKLGHVNCLTLTFLAFSLRFVFYYILQDPWYVLPIELLHGQTYATFYATMTSYAQVAAPPGSEATMQGVLGGLFEGLGVAVGSLLGGIGFDHLGGHHTFFSAALVSAACTISFCAIGQVLRLKKKGHIDIKVKSDIVTCQGHLT